MRFVIAGGGTAGHVFPAMALGEQLLARGHDVLFVGTDRGLETRLVPAAGYRLETVQVLPFPRRPSVGMVRAPLALRRSIARSRDLVADADVVVGMGGYASAPAVIAAARMHIPVVLHEQNAVPGAANRFLARRARVVALSFEAARGKIRGSADIVVTGNPIREQVAEVPSNREALASAAREVFGFSSERRTLVIFGGSQGALHVGDAGARLCGELADRADLQVLILAGEAHAESVASTVPVDRALRVCVLPFLDRMEHAYAVADLVVSRSGASSIAETTACGLPSVLIPYPHATGDHQQANADAVAAAGGAVVIRDAELSVPVLRAVVEPLIDDEEWRGRMARASAAFGRPDAGSLLADVVEREAASDGPVTREDGR